MKHEQIATISRLALAGFTPSEIINLRRISATLQRWHGLECGTGTDRVTVSVDRDEATGKPFERRQFMDSRGQWQDIRRPVGDREAGALKRLAAIMAAHPALASFVQGDPRGCALYILRPGDVPAGADSGAFYTRGVAVI